MNFLKTGDKIMSKLLFIFILFFTSSVQATWWIQDLSQPTEGEIEIFRGEDKLPVLFLMPLQKGDILHLPENATLTLVNSANKKEQLTAEKSPFSVPDSASLPTLLDNLLASLSRWFTTKMGQDTVVVSLTTRGDLNILGEPYPNTNYLQVGRNQLFMFFTGGTEPYTLNLEDAKGHPVSKLSFSTTCVKSESKKEQLLCKVTSTFAPLSKGEYELRLSDSTSEENGGVKRVVYKLKVTTDLPEKAKDLQKANLPNEVYGRYLAMILINDVNWRFEGLQLFSDYGMEKLIGLITRENDDDIPPSSLK